VIQQVMGLVSSAYSDKQNPTWFLQQTGTVFRKCHSCWLSS